MPRSALRRALAMALLVTLAAVPSACNQKPEGAVKVAVIGATPKIVDPSSGPLAPPDAVLLNNVAQGLVQEMGGRIWVDSEEGKGSRFAFVLPLAGPDVRDSAMEG